MMISRIRFVVCLLVLGFVATPVWGQEGRPCLEGKSCEVVEGTFPPEPEAGDAANAGDEIGDADNGAMADATAPPSAEPASEDLAAAPEADKPTTHGYVQRSREAERAIYQGALIVVASYLVPFAVGFVGLTLVAPAEPVALKVAPLMVPVGEPLITAALFDGSDTTWCLLGALGATQAFGIISLVLGATIQAHESTATFAPTGSGFRIHF